MTQNIYVSATITDFNYAVTSFALTIPDPNATITGILNGKFNSSAGLVIDSITGTINLLTSTPGNHNVSYTPLDADLDGQSGGDEYRNEVALTKLLISRPRALVMK